MCIHIKFPEKLQIRLTNFVATCADLSVISQDEEFIECRVLEKLYPVSVAAVERSCGRNCLSF